MVQCHKYIEYESLPMKTKAFVDNILPVMFIGEANRIMADVTSKDQEFWERVSQHDTYLTAEECLDYGIIDEII